jgi:hypothetical protein
MGSEALEVVILVSVIRFPSGSLHCSLQSSCAHKMLVDYPERVRKVDSCPTLAMYSRTDFAFARSYFHYRINCLISYAPYSLIYHTLLIGSKPPQGLYIRLYASNKGWFSSFSGDILKAFLSRFDHLNNRVFAADQ